MPDNLEDKSFTGNVVYTITVPGSGKVGGSFTFAEETLTGIHGINDTPYPNT